MPEIEENQDSNSLSDDLFNAAFDEAVKGEVEVETPPAVETSEVPKTPEVPPVVEAPEAKVETPAPVDIPAIIAATVAATRTPEPAKVDEPVVTGPTPEELAAEAQYRKDWPEHAAREDRLKAQLEEVKTLLATTTEALKGQIAPVIESANITAEEKHYSTIIRAHSDAVDIVPKVQEWIATQPKFLQPQYKAVLEKGSAADVVELFDTYKKTIPDSSVADAETARLAAEATEKAERLKRMAAPTTIRTSVTAEEDATDFDSAFEQEAKKYKIAA